jgi:hypothetical protein
LTIIIGSCSQLLYDLHNMVDINSEQTRDEAQHDLVVSELSSFGPLGPVRPWSLHSSLPLL